MRAPLAALALLLAACPGGGDKKANGPTPPPDAAEPAEPELTAEQAALVDRAVAMTVDAANTVLAAGDSCEARGAALDSWLDANDPERKRLDEQLADVPPKAKDARYREQATKNIEVLKGLSAVVDACAENAVFVDAFNRLGE
jgi:hypothetical protein